MCSYYIYVIEFMCLKNVSNPRCDRSIGVIIFDDTCRL